MNQPIKSVTVFCSANPNLDPAFTEAATLFTEGLVQRKLDLVYGAASVGLMGHFANTALKLGGTVRGAITAGLAQSSREMAHTGIQELVISKDLYDRKRWLIDHGDAFAIFPGGFGTLDEALEVISLKSLGYHDKPIAFVNVKGFWQTLEQVFKVFEDQGMIRKRASSASPLYEVCNTVDDIWRVFDGKKSGAAQI